MNYRSYTVFVIVALVVSRAAAEERMLAAMRTGEFALAIADAEAATDPLERDQGLARVAEAQLRAGAIRPARFTLARIESDRLRNGATLHQHGIPSPSRGDSTETLSAGARSTAGGGTQADFDTLIDLITSTVEPDSWEDLGGAGAIQGFAGGVFVDATGLLQRSSSTVSIRSAPDPIPMGWRSLSLPRLEKALQLSRGTGHPPGAEMLTLAGIDHVQMIVAYPETRDLVIAGPVAKNSNDGGLRLEDLIVVMHHAWFSEAPFGCSIDPRQQNLAATQEFLNQTSLSPIKPRLRERWVADVRDKMGRQDIQVFGIDPDTTTALSLVEADHHMKLVGLGLVPAVDGVPSYLELITDPKSLDLVRWWFKLGFDAIETNADRTSFQLLGPPARLVSENELLAEQGKRVATGNTSELNRRFTEAFTRHFDQLASRYPVYDRLRSVFQLATVAALIRHERLAERVGWNPTLLTELDHVAVGHVTVPTEVETVVNHRVLGGSQIVLVASGGVSVNTASALQQIRVVTDGHLDDARESSEPPHARGPREHWWWD